MGNKHGRSDSTNLTLPSRCSSRRSSIDHQVVSSRCRVWYRHSGEPKIDGIPNIPSTHLVTDYRTILREVGDHHITHMDIQRLDDVMPPLHVIAPHLTYLSIRGISNSCYIDCLKALQHLQVLHVWESNFSSGLPHVISELKSLIELRLYYCRLSDLPQSVKALQHLQVLHVWSSNFSSGLPHVISELTSLIELRLSYCRLPDVPQSLKALQHLQLLHVEGSNFSGGLPHVISKLTSLMELRLYDCQLSDLPQSLSNLKSLGRFHVGRNKFRGRLPPVVYQLDNLQVLDVQRNKDLTEIESDLLKLSKLSSIDCGECTSLQSPPYAVCEQGLTAITKYFNDLLVEAGTEIIVVPVAVVGNLMAGKTSLIRSLKAGKRVLTFRDVNSAKDETTKVFNMESLPLSDALVRLIDFGGHEVYHMAYQLTLKEQCVPLVVVNLAEYQQISAGRGHREATNQLCFDWLSQLYLACPQLGSPILALTHSDVLSEEEFNACKHQLLTSAEEIRLELVKEERELSNGSSDFCQIVHLSDLSKPLFHSWEVFVFSKEGDVDNAIKCLKECIEERAVEFKVKLPGLWERISSFIEQQEAKPYVLVSDVKAAFPNTYHVDIILRYLHNVGKVLWFEDKDSLSQYVFHQIPRIVEMIALLFHHSANEEWDRRIGSFTAFRHKNRTIEKATYIQMIEEYKLSGIMDEAILVNLLETSQLLPTKVAIELLNSFCIIHGSIQREQSNAYLIPYFSPRFMGREWKTDKYLQLRANILFNGLSLPGYVYQLITVTMLNFLSDPTYSVKAANNGATVLHGKSATHMVHDRNNKKVTLQVSTPVELIGPSWKRLIELAHHIISRTCSVWKATRPEVKFYCAHCLFNRADNPEYKVNPSWFRCTQHTESDGDEPPSVTTFSGIEPVVCANAELNSQGELTVPKPLRFPCYQLTNEEMSGLKRFLSELENRRPSSATSVVNNPVMSPEPTISFSQPVQETGPHEDTPSAQIESSLPTPSQEVPVVDPADHSVGLYYGARPRTSPYRVDPGRPASPDQQLTSEGDDDSELSDAEGYILSGLHSRQTSLHMVPCRKKRICRLYNTDKVYHMSDPVRGRILILNVNISHQNGKSVATRLGSEIDFRNLSKLFRDLGFHIVKSERELPHLTAQRIYEEIEEETKRSEHNKLGMFGLVLMGHGQRGEYLLDIENQPVDLVKLKDMLSSAMFPAMHGKPKLMIIQACASNDDVMLTVDGPVPSAKNTTAAPQTPSALDAADFYIMKATGESFAAIRSETHGSWFINMLVATFYKHACHRDIQSLFRIVQQRLGEYIAKHPPRLNARFSLPVDQCTFTDYRKLFLFPVSLQREKSSKHAAHDTQRQVMTHSDR